MKRLNVVLDDELHTKLKLTAFQKGKTISQYVIAILEKELEKDETNEEKQA